jgi:hypothetical protein
MPQAPSTPEAAAVAPQAALVEQALANGDRAAAHAAVERVPSHQRAAVVEALLRPSTERDAYAAYLDGARRFGVALAVDPGLTPPEWLRSRAAALAPSPPGPGDEVALQELASLRAAWIPESLADLPTLREMRALSPRVALEAALLGADVIMAAGGHDTAGAALHWLDETPLPRLAGPEEHDAAVVRARLLQLSGQPGAARAALDAVLDEDPLHGDARDVRAQLRLADLDDREEVAGALRDAQLAGFDLGRRRRLRLHLLRDPDLTLARAHLALGQAAEALTAARRLEVAPGDILPAALQRRRVRACALAKNGETRAAVADLGPIVGAGAEKALPGVIDDYWRDPR